MVEETWATEQQDNAKELLEEVKLLETQQGLFSSPIGGDFCSGKNMEKTAANSLGDPCRDMCEGVTSLEDVEANMLSGAGKTPASEGEIRKEQQEAQKQGMKKFGTCIWVGPDISSKTCKKRGPFVRAYAGWHPDTWEGNDWCHGMACFQAKMHAKIPIPFGINAGGSYSVIVNPIKLSFKQHVEITNVPMLGGFFLGSAYMKQEISNDAFLEAGGHAFLNGGHLRRRHHLQRQGQRSTETDKGLQVVYEAGFSVRTQNILGMLGKFFLKILKIVYIIIMTILKLAMWGFHYLVKKIIPFATKGLTLLVEAFECLTKIAFGIFLKALESDAFKEVQELMDKIFSVQEARCVVWMPLP
eukprot:g6267.t1